jgi:hypothetical protein
VSSEICRLVCGSKNLGGYGWIIETPLPMRGVNDCTFIAILIYRVPFKVLHESLTGLKTVSAELDPVWNEPLPPFNLK